MIARVLAAAKDHGNIAVNVFERGGCRQDADRSEVIGTADGIREFCSVASVEFQAVMLIALWAFSRIADRPDKA